MFVKCSCNFSHPLRIRAVMRYEGAMFAMRTITIIAPALAGGALLGLLLSCP